MHPKIHPTIPLIHPKPGLHPPKEDPAAHCAKLEKLVHEQSEEITNLQNQICEQREKNAAIQKRINEMKQFLEEYDLHWVGGPGPKERNFEHGPDDMELFMIRVKKLNEDAEAVKPKIKQVKNISKIQTDKPVLITLYNEHFTVNNGEERPYDETLSTQFFRDIYDGYYPEEFKETYPDGFVMNIVDKRTINQFKGRGRTIATAQSKIDGKKDPQYALNPDGEYGVGDGKLHLRLPSGREILKSSPNMTMHEVRKFIVSIFNLKNFEVIDPFKNSPYDDNATLSSLKLYPKGIVNVQLSEK